MICIILVVPQNKVKETGLLQNEANSPQVVNSSQVGDSSQDSAKAKSSSLVMLFHTLFFYRDIQLLLLSSFFAYFAHGLLIDWVGMYLVEYNKISLTQLAELLVWLEVRQCVC